MKRSSFLSPKRVAFRSRHREPAREVLACLLDYDPETGRFIWRERTWESESQYPWANKIWNKRFAGKEAGRISEGYRHITVMGVSFPAHRLAWVFVHGAPPHGDIDHVNHNPLDNRIGNLRVVDDAENAKNKKLNKTNTSGVTGVHWDKSRGKWAAAINANGKKCLIGRFETFDDAVVARAAAAAKFGYHANHGVGA